MILSGTRHPFLGKYKVAFENTGKITHLEAEVFSNAGYSMDLSLAVLERAMTHLDNVYNISNVKISGTMCKTNLTSNTAYTHPSSC